MREHPATLSIVIPVFRAEATLVELHQRLLRTLPGLVSDFEIIFVEDGGRDRSWAVISALAAMDPRVRGIRLSRNYGQHNALLAGIRAARHDLIMTMDDDLQHPATEIAPMLAALGSTNDVVYGAPQAGQHGLLRNLASRLTKIALTEAIGAETARHVSAFRLFRTRLRDGFRSYRSPFVSIDVLLTWSTSAFTAVEVRHDPRITGVSAYSLRKLIQHALNLMTGFSAIPLQVASLVGFAFVLLGIFMLLFVLANFLVHGSAVPAFAFLSSLITIFSGAQLFALGIFGEYLARMHFRSMDRPTYVVAEATGGGLPAGPDQPLVVAD